MTVSRHDARARVRVFGCAILLYLGFRLLGANKKHAWERAQLATVNAMIDKVVELTGIQNPRTKGGQA